MCQVANDVLYPTSILSKDLKAHRFRLASPVLNKLSKESHFGRHRWDPESRHHVVIGVSAHLVAYDFIRITFHHAVREWGVLGNVLENGKVSRRSLFYVVRFAAVVRPNEVIARSVAIYYEFDFLFAFGNEVSDGARFRL